MSKRKLNEQQRRRIANKQRAIKADSAGESHLGSVQKGCVIARHGAHVEVEGEDKKVYHCKLRQNIQSLVCGDSVLWQLGQDDIGVVIACNDRRSILGRPDASGELKPAAANIDRMLVIVAAEPALVLEMLDRYLVMAVTLNIAPIIVFNKSDLLIAGQRQLMEKTLAVYQEIGYSVLFTSAINQEGLNELASTLKNEVSVFVGQSGVGKSSLIAYLLRDETIRTGSVSATGKGRHTTTTARFYHFSKDGAIIDSPGVREFTLWQMKPQEVAKGFIEFADYLSQCKFRDCQHVHEPGCAVIEAVSKGGVSRERLARYQALIANL